MGHWLQSARKLLAHIATCIASRPHQGCHFCPHGQGRVRSPWHKRAHTRSHTLPFCYFAQLGHEGSSWLKACVHTCMSFLLIYVYIFSPSPFTMAEYNGRTAVRDVRFRSCMASSQGYQQSQQCLGHLTSTSRSVNLVTTAKNTACDVSN